MLQWGAGTDGKLYAGAGAVTLDVDGITLASAVSGGAGSLKTKSSTKLIGEYYTSRDGNDDVVGGVDLYNYDATSNVTSSFGVYHSAGLSSRFVSASTPTTSVNTIVGSKLVLNIRAATGTVVSLQDNLTNEYWALTNAGDMTYGSTLLSRIGAVLPAWGGGFEINNEASVGVHFRGPVAAVRYWTVDWLALVHPTDESAAFNLRRMVVSVWGQWPQRPTLHALLTRRRHGRRGQRRDHRARHQRHGGGGVRRGAGVSA